LGLRATRYGFRGTSENPGVAGNLVTTAEDFDRFLEMILNKGLFRGRRILSEEAVAAMEAGQTGNLPRDGHIPVRHLRTRHDLYGYGLWRDTVDGEGQLLVSSAPGKFGFTPWIDRRQGISGVLALEARGPKPLDRIPDPAGLQYLVCDILDTAQRRPVVRPEVNPNCRRWVQESP
jgi:CubicO group peptidase (beta-lactamase class C family)